MTSNTYSRDLIIWFVFLVALAVGAIWLGEQCDITDTAVVDDFSISAGGFMSSDVATIHTTDNRTISMSGLSGTRNLETGLEVVKCGSRWKVKK